VSGRSCANYLRPHFIRNEKLATGRARPYAAPMIEDAAERVAKLEAHLAHVERLCDQLNQVLVEHSREITKLKAQESRLAETIETAELERIRATNPKPPHYQ
jgi:uncharacterized coiled-coil protein SlyX